MRTFQKINIVFAIIGGGPAGITLAFILARKGYKITIFDAHEKIGGVRYGIPEYRLPNETIDKYEEKALELGVVIRPNTLIGPVITVDKLLTDGYKAVLLVHRLFGDLAIKPIKRKFRKCTLCHRLFKISICI